MRRLLIPIGAGKDSRPPSSRIGVLEFLLYMILPERGTNPEQILTEAALQEMLTANESFDLELSVPRFTIDISCSLKEPLTRLGMGVAFRYPEADFTALNSRGFYLGDVIHKARLEVDEEGTVAAAATAVWMSLGKLIEKRTLVFDRPFAVLLRGATGLILFAGVIYEP